MTFTICDGGRAAAGYRGDAGDCATRAIAIAAELPYRTVYDELHRRIAASKPRRAGYKGNSPRNGTPMPIVKAYLADLGWGWTATMGIGTGTTVHLRADELPSGRLIARVSKHLCAVIDGVIWDTYDPSRDGTRAVYGYWTPAP